MNRHIATGLFGLLVAGALSLAAGPATAQILLNPAYGETAARGPGQARGAVVWSHGRAVHHEDSTAPNPLYLKVLREAGWDVFRLDRMRVSDTLSNSARALAGHAEELKRKGYQRVVLAGQSFGAFISLIAAGHTDQVDAVIGTAPAAYGSFSEAYDSWRENANQLWPILHKVRSARVMLFFFHGDDFDPGGRGDPARSILAGRGIDHVVVDQPANLTGHGAANSGLFVRRFGACIARFAEAPPAPSEPPCDEAWGRNPSSDLMTVALPSERRVDAPPASGQQAARTATRKPPASARPFLGSWYGTYVNGREVMLSVERIDGAKVVADYVLGPGIEDGAGVERARRVGRIEDDTLIFEEKGRNVLRYSLRPDGRLAASWIEKGGKSRLDTVLRRVH